MIPIFEQRDSQGIGHSFDTFIRRFSDICKNHIESKRAHAFAFVFYDFTDSNLKNVLKSKGGFARLDRLSGRKLSVFYLHSNNRKLNKHFNDTFKYVFEIEDNINLPFVLFLKFDGEIAEIEELKISELEQDNPMFAFSELYDTIESYVAQLEKEIIDIESERNKLTNVINKYKRMAIHEFIKLILKDGYNMIKDY